MRIKAKSDVTAALLACVDEIVVDEKFPAPAGTMVMEDRVVLHLGELFVKASAPMKEEILKHEAGHLIALHGARCQGRNAIAISPEGQQVSLWNIVCDAAIHGSDQVDLDLMAEGGVMGVTFEGLQIPKCPPELAYDLLLRKAEKEGRLVEAPGCGCGRPMQDEKGMSVEGQTKLMAAAVDVAAANGVKGGTSGGGFRSLPAIPDPPPWVTEVIDRLVRTRMSERRRSWRRENRSNPTIFPGKSSCVSDAEGAIMLDASGSIDEAAVAMFLAATCQTPELQHMKVYVFSNHISQALPASDAGAVQTEITRHGGGTLIMKAFHAVEGVDQVVWLTDAYSGMDCHPRCHSMYGS